jgi:hypothetical protein
LADGIVESTEATSAKACSQVECKSAAINQRTQEVFKLRMDMIEFLPKGKLPEEYKKVLDTRWS